MMRQRHESRSDEEDTTATGEDPVDRLERWQQFGATWRVASRRAETVTISLCRCDGGEEIDRLTSDDANLLRWLAGRTSSEHPAATTVGDDPASGNA